MNGKSTCASLEEACNQIQALDIFNNAIDSEKFISVALACSKQEFLKEDIDLSQVVSNQVVKEFCALWLRETKPTENDLALIALNCAIKFYVKRLMVEQKRSRDDK